MSLSCLPINSTKSSNTGILRPSGSEETKVYGENACRALFLSRPECIIRAWFIQSKKNHFEEILYWMSTQHKAYHIVNNDIELIKVSGTNHHGGVCLLIKRRYGITPKQWINQSSLNTNDCVLALENIRNPHNLGAIMRTCAHFNTKGIILNNVALLESGAAIRTAEGGAEYVQPINSYDMLKTIKQFRKAGYTIITTSSHKNSFPLFKTTFPKKVVLILGQERNGVSNILISKSDLKISICGTHNIESLNVSVAAGIFLAEWWRQNKI